MPEIPPQPNTPQVVTKRSGFNWKSVLIAALIGVIVIIAAAAGSYYYLNQNQLSLETGSVTIKSATPSAKTATPSSQTGETTGWKTYTENGVSFKYPATWILGTVTRPSDKYVVTKATSVTSPSGFYLYFVTNLDGLGGGCGNDPTYMLNVDVYAIKQAGFNNYKGEAVNIVEWGVSGGFLLEKGQNFVRKEVLLGDNPDFPKLGNNDKGCLVYEQELSGSIYFSPLNPLLSAFHGQYPDDSSYQKLTPAEYFALPDVRTAEKILSSVKF